MREGLVMAMLKYFVAVHRRVFSTVISHRASRTFFHCPMYCIPENIHPDSGTTLSQSRFILCVRFDHSACGIRQSPVHSSRCSHRALQRPIHSPYKGRIVVAVKGVLSSAWARELCSSKRLDCQAPDYIAAHGSCLVSAVQLRLSLQFVVEIATTPGA